MTAPDTNDSDSEPSLTEAFSEFSEALAAEEEGGAPEREAAPEPEAAAPAAPAAPVAPVAGEKPDASAQQQQPQQPGQPGQQQPPQGGQQPSAAPPAQPERQPLTYTVEGQQRSFDGAFVLPGLGAVVTADALPKLQDRLQQADRLVAQNQALYQRTQEYERRGGAQAYEKLSADKAMLDASATLLLRALSDEATLVSLATDPVARQQLIKEIHLTAREASFTATNQVREAFARETEQQNSAGRTQTAIHNAVGYLAQEFQGLTAEDLDAVRSHASRMHVAIVRAATPAEAREANVQVGAPVIDLPMLHALLADRHGLRQAVAEQAQRRQTDSLENAARAAAAAPTTVANGHRPNGAPRPGAGKTQTAPAKKSLNEMSSSELTRAMKSGRIFDLMDDDEQ